MDTLAAYAGCDRRTVQRNIQLLIEDGWIEEDGRGPRGTRKFRLVFDRPEPTSSDAASGPDPQTPGAGACEPESGGRQIATGGASVAEGVAPMPPEPSLNRPSSSSAREREPDGGRREQVDQALAHLRPVVERQLLGDPMVDGSVMLLDSAISSYGLDVVLAALDRVIAWASDQQRPMRIRQLSRHLPAALEQARRAHRDEQGTPSDRPAWRSALAAIDAVVVQDGPVKDAIEQLRSQAPILAQLVIEVGWRQWAERPSGSAYGARDWERQTAALYQRLELDHQVIDTYLDLLDLNEQRRQALARGENPYAEDHPLNQPREVSPLRQPIDHGRHAA